MAIIFLGTSNCIVVDSFVDTVRELAEEDVINASIVASSSCAGLYFITAIDLKEGDVVFLDYTITDGYYIPHNQIDEVKIRKNFASLIRYINDANCIPVMLIKPCQFSLHGVTPSEEIHMKISREFRIPAVNVSNLFRQVVARGRTRKSLLRDDAHQSAIVTPVIGRALLNAVVSARALGPVVRLACDQTWAPRTILAAPLVELSQRISFSSRLRSSVMAVIRLGEKVRFDVGDEETALGLVVNMAGPGAKMLVTSPRGEEVRDLIYNWENDDPTRYMSIFVAFRQELGGGAVTLEVLPIDGPETEPEIFKPAILDRCYEAVSIEGLLVGASKSARSALGESEPPLPDLLETVYDELIHEIYEATADLEAV